MIKRKKIVKKEKKDFILLKLNHRLACAVASLCASHGAGGGTVPTSNDAFQVERKLEAFGVNKWDYYHHYVSEKKKFKGFK